MTDFKSFSYVGNETVGDTVAFRLQREGIALVEDIASAEVVFTYCTSQTQLEDVYFDDGGLIECSRPGTLLVDLSPSTPSFAREMDAVALVNELQPVEAPLAVVDPTQREAFADPKNLACFVGGEEDHVKRARPLLELFAATIDETGGAGSAQLARAAYTLQATAQIVSAIEAQALYSATRSSPSSFGQMEGDAGAATPLSEDVLRAVRGEKYESSYTVEMFMAELSAAITAADDVDLILPQAESALRLLEVLAVIGGADKGPAALSLIYGEEEACAKQGLDWTRAEEYYGTDSDSGHGHGDDDDDYGFDDLGGIGEGGDDDYGYSGYSDYSAN